jgi:hypothetical protein
MSLFKCVECDQEISDKADICVKCGYPLDAIKKSDSNKNILWNAVTKTKTPINVFALAMMACASLLGVSATQISDCYSHSAFTYTIHSFIAISGMFFLAVLFCRKGIYHPADLDKVKRETLKDLGKDRPFLAAILIAAMMVGYSYYQYKIPKPCDAEPIAINKNLMDDSIKVSIETEK